MSDYEYRISQMIARIAKFIIGAILLCVAFVLPIFAEDFNKHLWIPTMFVSILLIVKGAIWMLDAIFKQD